ncbi:MAG: hypothetical protein H6Q68_1297 [Firmicutes bacterium]|nr:hypothetical protein [Bacillota bacterium]
MNRIILEGMLNMDADKAQLLLNDRDLWNILSEYYLDGNYIKITIEEVE